MTPYRLDLITNQMPMCQCPNTEKCIFGCHPRNSESIVLAQRGDCQSLLTTAYYSGLKASFERAWALPLRLSLLRTKTVISAFRYAPLDSSPMYSYAPLDSSPRLRGLCYGCQKITTWQNLPEYFTDFPVCWGGGGGLMHFWCPNSDVWLR